MSQLEPDDIAACYKIILADEWKNLSERERRQYIRRMLYAKYGAFNHDEMFAYLSQNDNRHL